LLTVPLYTGGRHLAERRAARAGTEAAKHESDAIRNALGFEVSRAFHTILKTRRFIESAEAAVASFSTNVVIARRRLEGGTLLKADVLDIEVRLAQAREEAVRARNAHRLAERALLNLLGLEDDQFAVADSVPVVSAPGEGDYLRRPELAAARAREASAQAQLRAARGGYAPRLNAFGSLDYDHGWVTDGSGRSYTAGVMAQWDLWDGFSTRARIRLAAANLESAHENERKLRLAIEFEVQQARLDVNAAAERLTVSATSVEQAAESADLTRKRFEQGLALATQLIDSETALVAARVRRAEAESDQRIAIAALRKALALPQLDVPQSLEAR
jgi:outer membrane protein TolC